MPVRSPARCRRVLAAAALLVLTGGCTDASAPVSGPGSGSARAPDPVERYAALGDSYTAAPFVPDTALADGCLRSSGNYPSLVADELGARLVDVSCSAATTGDVSAAQSVAGGRAAVPPQLSAVTPGTDLVTVGLGGNDEDLFASLLLGCVRLAGPGAPSRGGDVACRAALADGGRQALAVVARTGRRVEQVLRRVTDQAPSAQVVLVAYPRLVDPARSCADLPLRAPVRVVAARVERALAAALRRAAAATGASYADLYAASRGHEVCSADPWVNGRRTDEQQALAFHPFPAGQRAAADEVLRLVDEGAP